MDYTRAISSSSQFPTDYMNCNLQIALKKILFLIKRETLLEDDDVESRGNSALPPDNSAMIQFPAIPLLWDSRAG